MWEGRSGGSEGKPGKTSDAWEVQLLGLLSVDFERILDAGVSAALAWIAWVGNPSLRVCVKRDLVPLPLRGLRGWQCCFGTPQLTMWGGGTF